MFKDGMTTLGKTGAGLFGNLKAKQIKPVGSDRGISRRKGIAKRSFGGSLKK